MEKQIKWFSKNHVAANFLMLVVVLMGFATWFKLRKEVFPETELDAVLVQVAFPNATPAEVEDGVILPIEDAIRSIEGIKRFTSSSAEGIGALTIEVKNGYEVRNVMNDVKSKVDGIRTFPEFAEKPIYEELVLKAQVMSIAVSADVDERTLRKYAQVVRDGLLDHRMSKDAKSEAKGLDKFAEGISKIPSTISRFVRGEPSISEVELAAVKPLEISIEVSEDTLRQYNLTLEQVAQRIRASSLDLPGGSIKTQSGDVLVRAKGKRYTAKDFETIDIVTRPDGSVLKLGDIATVIDGFEDVEIRSRFDGRRAALVNVYRSGEEDTLEITELARDYIENVASTQLPEGVNVEVWGDTSKMLKGRLNLLGRNGATGLVLVFIVLALFLRPSLAALVALGIPVSFAGGIWLMPMLGVSINMISLFAFILVLGIVVDDAIVVGENVYSRIRSGEDPKVASWKGTHEVGVVVIFGILTTMAAFTPMIGLSGVSGKIWPNIPYVVIPVLAFSLVQSKFVLPAHLAFLKSRDQNKTNHGWVTLLQHKVADGLEWLIQHIYRPFLKLCLQFRYAVWAIFIALLMIAGGLVSSGRIPFEFMPKVEGDMVSAKLEMPYGVKFDSTADAIEALEKAAYRVGERHKDENGDPIIIHMLASSGTQPFLTGFGGGGVPVGSHLGEVTIELTPAAGRSISADDFINEWRKEIGEIPGAVELSFRQETAAGGNAIDIEITGRNLDHLQDASLHIVNELRNMEGTKDITTSNRLGKRELVFEELTPQGKSRNFTLNDVARQIRSAIYGDEVQRIQRGRDEVKVMVRYPEEDRKSLDTIEKIKLHAPGGGEVPIAQVVTGAPDRGAATIYHVDGVRSIKISGDVNRKVANATKVAQSLESDVLMKLGEKFPGVKWSYLGEQKDQNDSVREMAGKFIFALLMMYILIAIPLKSYTQPFIIMSVIPFGIVGAVAGHMLMGMNLSIMSLCGIVALSGVVVNDSLVLVDYVNRHKDDGGDVLEAAWNAGARRFRPILLTSLTTFAGLMPMLLETDMQARFLIPMAVSLGFGILFATGITLILVPSVYLMLEDVKWLLGGVLAKREETSDS